MKQVLVLSAHEVQVEYLASQHVRCGNTVKLKSQKKLIFEIIEIFLISSNLRALW